MANKILIIIISIIIFIRYYVKGRTITIEDNYYEGLGLLNVTRAIYNLESEE